MSKEKSGVPDVQDAPKVPDVPKNPGDEIETKKRTKNPLKLMWHGVKFCARKVRESPAAAVIGAGITAIGIEGTRFVLDLMKNRKEVEVTNPDPEPVETEFTDEYDNVAPPEDAAEE